MDKVKALKSSVGPPAEGESKFFPRNKIVNKIIRTINNGENILISAPRRIGKSSILKYIKNNQQKDQIIKYMIVQSVDSSEEFFKKLFNELLNDKDIFDGIGGYWARTGSTVKKYASRITGFSIEGSIELDPDEHIDYYHECLQLIKNIQVNDKKIIIFVDEYPDALNNILEKDKQLAIKFLQQNRELIELFSDCNLQFVYTGSTGLKNIVKKLDRLDLVNHLKTIKISPFTKDEAKELIQRLILGFKEENCNFDVSDKVVEYILQKISWRIPYYMQIIIDELFDFYEDTEKPIDETTIEFVLSEIVKSKSNHSDYFENWKRRLKTAFQNQDYDFAIEVLNYIAKNNTIEHSVFYDLATKNKVEDTRYILDVLEYDGYISEDQKKYGFNSILLKEWWYINVAT
ncbi:MAG: hypothetical protein QM479_15170 [Pseudomonadota bacterium]